MAVGRLLMFHKCCLIFTTFLVGVLGLGLVCSGLWLRFEPEFRRYVDATDNFNFLYAFAYIVMCVGVVIAVVAALGCFGAVKNNICIIVTFFIALLIIFSVYTTMVAAAILAILQKQTLLQLLGDALKEKLLLRYYDDQPSRQLMSAIQTQFNCCGADKGISDYVTYTGRKSHPGVCPLELFGQPCNIAIVEYAHKHDLVISTGAATGAIVMIIGLIQSIFLCRAIRDLHSRAEQNGGSSIASRMVTSSSVQDDIKMADDDYLQRQQTQQQQQQKKQQRQQQQQKLNEPHAINNSIDR